MQWLQLVLCIMVFFIPRCFPTMFPKTNVDSTNICFVALEQHQVTFNLMWHIRLNVFRTSQRYFYMKRNYFSWLAYTPYVPYYMIMLLLRNTSNTFSMISNVRDRISDNTQDMSKKAWHQLESCQKWKNEKLLWNFVSHYYNVIFRGDIGNGFSVSFLVTISPNSLSGRVLW